MSDTHPTKRLRAPDGSRADIDVLLVPLIEALWDAGYETIGCCQDLGESAGTISARSREKWAGYVLVEMPVEHAARLLDFIYDTDEFAPYMHWADDGAWEVTIQIIPMPDRAMVAPWAQIHFPNYQIDDLAKVLRDA